MPSCDDILALPALSRPGVPSGLMAVQSRFLGLGLGLGLGWFLGLGVFWVRSCECELLSWKRRRREER